MKNVFLILLGFTILSSAEAAPVSINTSSTTGNAIPSPSIGATLSTTTRPYEGIGSQMAILPFFGITTGRFYVRGLDVGFQLNRYRTLQWDLIAIPRFLGYKESDSAVLNGLENTDYSIHGGISAGTAAGPVNLNIRLLTDLVNESGGTEAMGSVSRVYTFDRLDISPALAINWQNSKLVDHYYGIDVSQSGTGRDAYSGNATINSSVSLTATYSMTDTFTVIGATRFDHYGSEITDSPIVSNNDSSSFTVGVVYLY